MRRRTIPVTCLLAIGAWTLEPALPAETVSLRRVTLDVPQIETGFDADGNRTFREEEPHPGVEMVAGRNRVVFDSWYGGAIRLWYLDGAPDGYQESIIWPNPGAAFNVVYDTGQDATQTFSGTAHNPIGRLDDPLSMTRDGYYLREALFSPPDPHDSSSSAVYEIRGAAPFWWHDLGGNGSRERAPVSATSGGSGWCQLDLVGQPGECRPCLDCVTGRAGGIWFDGQIAPGNEGALFMANHHLPVGDPAEWASRLHEIQEGRVAFKVHVDLTLATSDHAFAAVMFRRQVPDTLVGADVQGAAFTPGYWLAVNRLGTVQLVRFENGIPEPVWTCDGCAPDVRTRAVKLEIRTHNRLPDHLWVWIDDERKTRFVDPAPILGSHFGYYAWTPGGYVGFLEDAVYDMGIRFRARYTGRPDGVIAVDVHVGNARGSDLSRDYYPIGTPAAFFNPIYSGPPLSRGRITDACGRLATRFLGSSLGGGVNCLGGAPGPPNPTDDDAFFVAPIKNHNSDAYAFWVGDPGYSSGLYVQPRRTVLDGVGAAAAHALFTTSAMQHTPLTYLPCNDDAPTAAKSFRTITWLDPEGPSCSLADQATELALIEPGFSDWHVYDPASSPPGKEIDEIQWGLPDDQYLAGEPVSGMAADGIDELIVYRERPATGLGEWHVLNRITGELFSRSSFGLAADHAVIGDFIGDGLDNAAVAQSDLFFIVDNDRNLAFDPDLDTIFSWSPDPAIGPNDRLLACELGTATGAADGLDDLVIWRADQGRWEIYYFEPQGPSSEPGLVVNFGSPGDLPMVGRLGEDELCELMLFRPTDDTVYVNDSANGYGDYEIDGSIPLINSDWDAEALALQYR